MVQTVRVPDLGVQVSAASDEKGVLVLRDNGEQFTRPVVEIWRPEDSASAEVVDLSALDEEELQIVRPLPESPPGKPPSPLDSQFAEDFWE